MPLARDNRNELNLRDRHRMTERIVIVGAGQAGVQVAEALRAGGFAGSVTLLGAENHAPYHRPPLSKAWLAGEATEAQLVLRAPEALARKQIELRSGATAVAIDRERRRVRLGDGSELEYDRLALATGATARRLAIAGASAPNVLVLRSRDDADAIGRGLASCLESGRPVAVIGGGFIGLEIAATARKRGVAVTVFEALPRLMARALAPPLAAWFADLHRRNGVRIELAARIDRIEQGGAGAGPPATAVVDGHGESHPAALVIVGVGVEPDDALARAAGLACERGIIVDACGRTDDPLIVAAGDCTARRVADGKLVRLESVNNAVEQGRSAAAALLGVERPFVAAPWFWSDQYDARLQMVGLSAAANRSVVRGDPAAGKFSWFHYRDDRLIAVDSVNAMKDHLAARKLLDAGRSPSADQVVDPAFDLAGALANPS
jgi:3-phenylpropionate/trans-cinnamate dioxygenase ferredoxin reductase subunit